MTMRELVTNLQANGHKVTYNVRRDGGIRITSLDGIKYTGSNGNKVARALTGATLSTRREAQLKKIRTKKGNWGHRKRVNPLPDDVVKRIRKIQRLMRKNEINRTGIVTQRNYRYVLKTEGKEEADRRLAQAERYALGLAYTENVDALLSRLKQDLDKRNDANVRKARKLIKDKREEFKEKWLSEILESLYLWEKRQINGASFLAKVEDTIKAN